MRALHTILEAVIALLAAAGLLALGWMLFGRLLAPVGGKGGGRVFAVLPVKGAGETLEHDVTGLLWLRGGGMARFTVLIADAGLDEEGRKLAGLLAQRENGVELCSVEELGERMNGE